MIGGFQNCAERGPHNCNPNLNPGGAFCCLKDLAPTGTSRPAPAIDAGTAAGSGAAGAGGAGAVSDTDADGGSDPGDYYACQTDADCAVKNVGNCCGYYPRCVNKDSVIPPYVCPPGVGSVCGWPDIDACSCRQGTCRSLQNGNEI